MAGALLETAHLAGGMANGPAHLPGDLLGDAVLHGDEGIDRLRTKGRPLVQGRLPPGGLCPDRGLHGQADSPAGGVVPLHEDADSPVPTAARSSLNPRRLPQGARIGDPGQGCLSGLGGFFIENGQRFSETGIDMPQGKTPRFREITLPEALPQALFKYFLSL